MLNFLKEEKINPALLSCVEKYREAYPDGGLDLRSSSGSDKTPDLRSSSGSDRTPDSDRQSAAGNLPRYLYYGKEVWEQALHALLCGENLLLAGSKATGKNVLAENLAAVFARPIWNVSFHINMDASYMIGADTFQNGEVVFRPGPVYQCADKGGFCILDEINMARNESLAVLHSLLDFRKTVHVPGYGQLSIHPATRFIATMNYGYSGTRELNEALSSRFMVIQMPEITADNLTKLLRHEFPRMKKQYAEQFSGLFSDIEKKCKNGELTEKALDLRGLLDALRLIENGLSPSLALDMGITNKTFDLYEQTLVRDIISSRISRKADFSAIFEGSRFEGSRFEDSRFEGSRHE